MVLALFCFLCLLLSLCPLWLICRFELITKEDTEKNSFWSLQRRQHGDEIFREAPAIIRKQLIHSLKFFRAHNQANVMTLLHAIENLRVVVSGCVRIFLFRQRKNDAGVFFARPQRFSMTISRNFQTRPFAPKIDPRSSFQNIGDVSAANTRRDFQKVKLAVSFALDELGMR